MRCLSALTRSVRGTRTATELVLRGIFMLRRKELEWFYEEKNGASFLYPDAWEHYVAAIPEEERGDMMGAYNKRLTSDDPEVRLAAARSWSIWEGSACNLCRVVAFIQALTCASGRPCEQ